MRKIVLLATLLALAALMMAASPAMAQVDLDLDDEVDANDFVVLVEDDDGFDDCVAIDGTIICDDDDEDFGFFGFDDVDGFGVENEAESGDVDISFGVSNEGDFAMQCTPALQFGNTGNFNNAPAFLQFGSGGTVDRRNDFGFFGFDDDLNDLVFFGDRFDGGGIDDFEAGGIDVSFSPELAVDCNQAVQQSSAASS